MANGDNNISPFEQQLQGFATQAQGADKFQEDVFKNQVDELRGQFFNQFGDVQKNLQSKDVFITQTLFRQPVGKTTDVGQGFKLRKEEDTPRDAQGRSFNQISLLDPEGNVVRTIRHSDSGSTRQQLTEAFSEATGFGFLGTAGLSSGDAANRAARIVGDLGLASSRALRGDPVPDAVQRFRDQQAGGVQETTEVATATPSGQVQIAGEQVSVIPFKDGLTLEQETGITNLVNSGRAFNETDARNFAFATGQSNFNQFIGKTGDQAKALLGVTGRLGETPTVSPTTPETSLLDVVTRQAQELGNNVIANADFINGAFKALHGRDATQEELDRFAGQGVQSVFNAVRAGAPTLTEQSLTDLVPDRTGANVVAADGVDNILSSPGRTTPGDLLATVGNNLAVLGMTETEQLLQQFLDIQAGQIAGERAPIAAEEEALKDKLRDKLDSSFFEDEQRGLLDEFKVQELQDELGRNRQRIQNEIASRDLGLQSIGDQPIAASIMFGQKRKLQEQAAARIGALDVERAALTGEIGVALDISDRVFDAIKLDRNEQIGALNDLLDMARNDRIQLDEEEKDNINSQIKLLENANARLEDNAAQVRDLIISDPELAGAAGISLTDTIDDAVGKIAQGAGVSTSRIAQLIKRRTTKTKSSGGGSAGGVAPVGETLTFQEYLDQVFIPSFGQSVGQSPNLEDPEVELEARRLYQEFLAEDQAAASTAFLSPDERKALRSQTGFTEGQLVKLQQAGLQRAPFQEQLDFIANGNQSDLEAFTASLIEQATANQ